MFQPLVNTSVFEFLLDYTRTDWIMTFTSSYNAGAGGRVETKLLKATDEREFPEYPHSVVVLIVELKVSGFARDRQAHCN